MVTGLSVQRNSVPYTQFIDGISTLCYILDMSEAKKKQVRKVTVSFRRGGNEFGDEVYKVVVDSDSTVDKEIDWRLEHMKDDDGMSWKIESDELIKEV